jgi:tetrahydromethanopterin S-methyltransferase subunit C
MSDQKPISHVSVMALGIIGALVGIYLSPVNPVIGPLLAALGGVCAVVWGADAIRTIASYGLGTGVPSIGYMSLAIGIIGALAGLAGGVIIGMSIAGPIMGFILAMVLGGIVAIIGRKIVGMKIPVLIRGSIELAGASGLSVLAFSAAIAGSYSMTAILQYVIATGFIGLLFILNTMVIQHPFNACLGPNEDQRRTLKLASTTAFFAMAIVGVLGVGTHPAWWVIAVIGAIGWFISFRAFLHDSVEHAASVRWSGLWPKEDEQ